MDKKEMRAYIRARKRAMTEAQIVSASARLGELFRACELYKKADTSYGDLPYNQEVRTVPMLEQAIADGKRVAVPKCYGEEMRFLYINDFVNEVGHRIGYGGGFYDRFLSAEPDHPTLALCYGFQMVEHLETEEFDIPVDMVLWADPAEE